MAKLRILLVEDEIITAMDIKSDLFELGYEVPAVAASGAEAIRLTAELRPDLILMDITLAGAMSGIEAAEQIRLAQQIPVIFLTAHLDSDTVARAKRAQPYGYLNKPYNLDSMMKTIEVAFYKSEADAKVRASESYYRLLAENVTDLVSRHTPSGVYLYASPSFWELIGYTPEELVGRDIYDFIHPDDLEEVQNIHGNILEYPQSHKVSYRFRRKDGDFLWVESNSKTIRNPETGDVQELINVTRDISERMLAKNKLLEKNAELERFAYTISHDLKSPLVTIRGFIGRLLKNFAAGRNENALEYLQRIDHAAGKMEALLSDLLALSVAGKVISAPEKIALAQLVDNVLRLLEGAIQAGRVTVSVQPDLPTVTVDRLRLFQVLQNLLENAIKYRGDQPDLRIRIGARQEGEERVFFVQDNGAGIDRHHQESIFGLFKKLDAKSTGAGIGLATIKRIINAHGGHIWVESDGVGKGSCFCFTLGAFDAGH